ncbi:MAG: class I SAM-dependent methyltransferase [Opitutaceae bacterium]|nr:class I SAM-dependent methyltransferase [Opitutaceae bacterium]
MKYRESGMPAQDYWETLFDVPLILDRFGFGAATADIAELGCGYGTFTVPLARRIRGTVHAFDIDPAMIAHTRRRAAEAGLANIRVSVRDVATEGYGLPDGACDACLLFNILHGEAPVAMLQTAARVVRSGGFVAVIHWRDDIATPRGPSAAIRPSPEQILAWVETTGGLAAAEPSFLLPPWHYGVKLRRIGNLSSRSKPGLGGKSAP